MKHLNLFIQKNVKLFEMIGVVMRIISFTLVSWLGPESPFLFVWIFNTIDAALLSWCAILKKDRAYSLLNVFWIIVGVVGILRASGHLHK
jgi:phosphoglycerol transferase MdoB-like AlkP superfamily enzyme